LRKISQGRDFFLQEVLKAKGNQAFGCENFAKAIDYYTQAIQINESNHLLYANRAACYLSLGQPMFAKVDAIKCVGIEPKYVKGHYRLAEAHMMLHDYERALRDVETGLKISPTEPSFAELKQKIEHIIAERDYLPADKPIEGLTQFPQAKYLHPRRDVIFGSGSNDDGSVRVWVGVVHYIDATLWSNCLQLRVLLRNLGERALALTKADVFQWTLGMRNGISRLKAKQPENERENLADPSHVSIIEVNGSDISSKQLESVVLGQGNWAIVSFAFRVPMARYESEALKRSASMNVHVNDPSGGPGETRKEVEITFNQDTVKKYYKGFRPGLICGQPGTGEAIFPKWRPDPGLTASEKKMVLSSNFNDEEYSHGFALKIRDADSKFVVYSYILIKSLSFDEIRKAAKDLLDKENLRKDVRSLIKNPERLFLRNDADLKKANIADDSELDVDFQPYPLDDID
jgi:tetratricopeptide (TPR) repeat protein